MVPSFSSKGFPYYLPDSWPHKSELPRQRKSVKSSSKRKFSDASLSLELTGPYIEDALLLSAYDLHFRLLDRPERFFGSKKLVFIDSGGYELAPEFDATEPKQYRYRPRRPFGLSEYLRVLDDLPKTVPCVIANFDWGTRYRPVTQQIAKARALFHRHPSSLSNFLIKPGTGAFLEIEKRVRPELSAMRGFAIVGVTEKELGANLLTKLRTLASLRLAMDHCKMQEVPIHLWGGLDPLLVPLYFIAGAGIFDGVSWLRYAYHHGAAIAWDSNSVLKGRVADSAMRARALTSGENLVVLESLATSMKRLADNRASDFSVFNYYAEELEAAYRTMVAEIPELRSTGSRRPVETI